MDKENIVDKENIKAGAYLGGLWGPEPSGVTKGGAKKKEKRKHRQRKKERKNRKRRENDRKMKERGGKKEKIKVS